MSRRACNNYIRRSGVYQIRCKLNDKLYVGSTKDIQRRLGNHRAELARGVSIHKRLQEDWDRFGPDAFVFEVLELVSELRQLTQIEHSWIMNLGSYKPLLGYNVDRRAREIKLAIPRITSGSIVMRSGNPGKIPKS